MQKNEKPPISPCDVSLVTPGKSSRLLAMRDKAVTADAVGQECSAIAATLKLSPELLLARLVIDQRMTEIMTMLPPGKQRRLFKIRYGVELEQIRNLPIKQVCKLLDIAWPANQNPATVMKLIGDLNYNGKLA
jgi:hypothetical protein